MPLGTEPHLEGNGPIPCQLVGEESHFGFHAPSSLASVNVNSPSNTDSEHSDQGNNPIDPILRTPVCVELKDVGHDNISKWGLSIFISTFSICSFTP